MFLPRSARSTCAVMLGLAAALAHPGAAMATDLAPGLSKQRTSMTVSAVTPRGPYLEAELDMSGKVFFGYALPSEACSGVFEPAAEVVYVDSGPLGWFERGELRCQLLGVGNLRIWRDRSRRSSAQLAPRSQASYRLIHRDDEVALLRGVFPQASRLGFSGSSDLVAIVPVSDVCSGPIERNTSSLEYRDKGANVLALVGADGLCNLRGLAQPPPQVQPEPGSGRDEGDAGTDDEG